MKPKLFGFVRKSAVSTNRFDISDAVVGVNLCGGQSDQVFVSGLDFESFLERQWEVAGRSDESVESGDVGIDGKSFDQIGVGIEVDGQPQVDPGPRGRLLIVKVPIRQSRVLKSCRFVGPLQVVHQSGVGRVLEDVLGCSPVEGAAHSSVRRKLIEDGRTGNGQT